jgi:hypothetical protein
MTVKSIPSWIRERIWDQLESEGRTVSRIALSSTQMERRLTNALIVLARCKAQISIETMALIGI